MGLASWATLSRPFGTQFVSEFSRRLFGPCHRTSHANCPSAGNSKQLTDATTVERCLSLSSDNAVKTQIWCAIAYVVIAIIKKELQLNVSLYLVYRFSPSQSLKNTDFMRPAANHFKPHLRYHANQLILFDI